ncbi:hypothetical protein hrd7_23830 [Leptolinea sp. HRD-7]|nr:hypothetical protein hrd7_23830 [Leptolinea sp. HRD-7]
MPRCGWEQSWLQIMCVQAQQLPVMLLESAWRRMVNSQLKAWKLEEPEKEVKAFCELCSLTKGFPFKRRTITFYLKQ